MRVARQVCLALLLQWAQVRKQGMKGITSKRGEHEIQGSTPAIRKQPVSTVLILHSSRYTALKSWPLRCLAQPWWLQQPSR
jgi:hypothetical protein